MILEHCEGDYFAVAVVSTTGSGTVVGAYDPLGYAAKVEVYSNEDVYTPVDIKYDRITQQLHLLQRSHYDEGHVLHLNSSMVYGTGTVPGHYFLDHDLFSIDRVSSSAGDVVATGRSNISGHPQITWVYKLNAAMWESCAKETGLKYKQPKDFEPCLLDMGLVNGRLLSPPEEPNNTIINYYKTFFCE